MKTKRAFSLILSIICIVTLCIPVCAVETRASDQIAVYGIDVTPHSGYFSVFFTVTGPGYVDKIGCESIYFYKMVDSVWVPISSLTRLENDPGMSSLNDYEYTNNLRFSSESGEAYKIVVTIFSENSKGRDTRSKVFYEISQ